MRDGPKMRIRLVVSECMNNKGAEEDGKIRLPRKARANFKPKGQRILLDINDKQKVLHVHQAFSDDVRSIAKELQKGTISPTQAGRTGFVTLGTLKHFSRNKLAYDSKKLYITDSISSIVIGADPEFSILDPKTNRVKYALTAIGAGLKNRLGEDGHCVEVRPPPSSSIIKVVQNISDILNEDGPKIISNFNWVGGATYANKNYPQDRVSQHGGHLHFGNPALLPRELEAAAYPRIVRMLDEMVALPMVRIDTPDPFFRRNKGLYKKYGRWGDFKSQQEGGRRFEWRVLSGLWMVHPELAEPVMATTKAVVEAGYQLIAENGFSEEWVSAPVNKPGFLKSWNLIGERKVSKIINDADSEAVSPDLLLKTAKNLRNLPTYKKYKGQIEGFIKLINLSDRDRGKISLDIKKNWLNGGQLITK